jgi:hypothetical protein
MKIKNFLIKKTPFLLTLALTSCASYRASPLNNPSPDLVSSTPQTEGISIVSQTFTRGDCKRFFDRDVIAKGYQPVQISIQNDTKNSYLFALNRISLPIARAEEVAEKVHTSTVGRATGYGVGALFLWPLAIPAIVDGIKSANANEALDRDFLAKTARDQVIFPHSRLNAVIFVPCDAFQNAYTITLIDPNTQEPKVFHLMSQ